MSEAALMMAGFEAQVRYVRPESDGRQGIGCSATVCAHGTPLLAVTIIAGEDGLAAYLDDAKVRRLHGMLEEFLARRAADLPPAPGGRH